MLWVLAIVAIVFVMILSRVDDWDRDFTTNVATTSPSTDLKPLRLAISPDQATEQLKQRIASMPRWSWVEQSRSPEGVVTITLVRQTTLFRFKDDVQVSIAPDLDGTGVVLNATSRSRVGKGDLGQNPRNIKELFAAMQ